MARVSDVYDAYGDSGLTAYAAPGASDHAQYEANYRSYLPAARTGRILDIGCGAGGFLSWVGAAGYASAQGVDVSEAAVEACRRRGIAAVERIDDLQGWLQAAEPGFGLVAMNDVIEHLTRTEVLEVLGLVRGLLAPDGVLLVKTLNMANPGGRYLRYADFTHELGFTETSMRQALAAAGFAAVEVHDYAIPVRTAQGRVWLAAGRVWQRALAAALVLDVGSDRPRILSKLLFAAARPGAPAPQSPTST